MPDGALAPKARTPREFGEWLHAVAPQYVWDWPHLVAIRRELAAIESGTIDRLLITAPPQHGKSLQGSAHWPAYLLERDPTRRIILASHNTILAAGFSRAARRLVRDRVRLRQDRQAVTEWETEAGGSYLAVGIGSGVTGHPGDIGIIDDPVRGFKEAYSRAHREAVWNWYLTEFSTRFPHGRIVLTLTRWHHDDLAGRLLKAEPRRWRVLNLPALAEARDPLGRALGEALCEARATRAYLEAERELKGRFFTALFQGHPTEDEGAIVNRERFVDYDDLPPREDWWHVILSVDTGDKATTLHDPSVALLGVLTRTRHLYLAELWRDRVEFPTLERTFLGDADLARPGAKRGLLREWRPTVLLIEDRGNGRALGQLLREKGAHGVPVLLIEPDGDKVMRMSQESPAIDAGSVHLPRYAPWRETFLAEMADFPAGEHDDQVDALSQLLKWARTQAGEAYTETAGPRSPAIQDAAADLLPASGWDTF